MENDCIFNGQGTGDVGTKLMSCNMDTGVLRPYIGADGRNYITLNNNGSPQEIVTNAPATLLKDQWIHLDTAIIKAAKPRLNVVADLRSAGLQYNMVDGMGKTVLQHQTQSDITDATISMDGLREGASDRPQFGLNSLPLPITHKDFHFSIREIMESRKSGAPLDTTNAEAAARRVAESVEKLTLGVSGSYTYGGGSVYGLTNYPQRLTKSLTAPTGSNNEVVVMEVLEMREQSIANYYYGPWVLYHSPAYYAYMDSDYDTANRNGATLRERLMKIKGITDVKAADYLTGTSLLLVQQTSDVVRMVNGMEITTLQWESHGGMMLNFKVMCIMVPQLRCDYNSCTGIVHGEV